MIKEKLAEDLKTAMKGHDANTVSVIRMLLAAIKNKEIEKREALDDGAVAKILAGEKKKHLDSIAQFEQGGRADLVAREQAETRVIEKYLPEPLGNEELAALVAQAAAGAGPGDFGKVMKAAMAAAAGRAGGAAVSQMVKERLNKNN